MHPVEPTPEAPPPLQPASPFAHPAWTVGVVLIFGVVSLLLGIVGHPVWFLLGSPFILTLLVWIGVKVTVWRRGDDGRVDGEDCGGV